MRAYRDARAQRGKGSAPRQFWAALLGFDGYLRGQSAWLVNYAARHRAGLRVGTAITEGAANHLVNRRMNKSQQMRWTRRGADLLLQVRCAVYNGQIALDLAQFAYESRGGSAAIGSLEASDNPRAAHRARRGDAGSKRGHARAAA